ncbi:AAA family ATPase, partial [Nocardia farcinica]|uniref:AAA family ATPase n=1 Tax=Nocardia farcinica TaxID=37329 RepID=UPI0024561B0D
MGWKRVAGTAPAAMVARRIADDPAVPPDVRAAVLDALGATDPPPEPAVGGLSDVFLRAIRVRGFRGIGAETELALRPGPGLTLVVGRNGCGKSSFAEAAELALTGGNRRWDGRSAAWREGWRNLHDGANPRIELELLTGAAESAPVVVKEWTARAELHEARWVMRGADGDPAEFDADGWAPVLELYRPFLSYSELGALVDGKPSDLFDALHQLLGLDDLIAAHTRLRGRRLEQERAVKQCRQQRLELRTDLAAVADDRAAPRRAQRDNPRPGQAAVGPGVRGGAGAGPRGPPRGARPGLPPAGALGAGAGGPGRPAAHPPAHRRQVRALGVEQGQEPGGGGGGGGRPARGGGARPPGRARNVGGLGGAQAPPARRGG